ncbi:MAG: TIGR01212 family radical SAM protein [Candidatus Omnitrophica bacterium]|nr:TIGR01212 family radical SAM protein [Candidatus Omnitrophota bacterium]
MRYYSFNNYLRAKYGCRVHRLSLDAGFTCPNKDGKVGSGGCIFCNEQAFSVFAGKKLSLDAQIGESMEFARKRYGAEKFIAYFQNGSGTYGSTETLKQKYDTIRKYEDIVGLFISTRPDCIDEKNLDLIAEYLKDYEVWIELGLQTVHDRTLEFINRGHTFKQTEEAIQAIADRGIKVAVHLIAGLPGETADDMLETVKTIAKLPVAGVKFHVLHVLRDTPLENYYKQGKINLLDEGKYVNIISDLLAHIPKDWVILRLVSDANRKVLVAPDWVLRKQEIVEKIEKQLIKSGLCQGKLLEDKKGESK